MTATLQFNLPEETEEFQFAINGTKWHSVLWELDQDLRAKIKHDDSLTDDYHSALEDTRMKINELMRDYNISFD